MNMIVHKIGFFSFIFSDFLPECIKLMILKRLMIKLLNIITTRYMIAKYRIVFPIAVPDIVN